MRKGWVLIRMDMHPCTIGELYWFYSYNWSPAGAKCDHTGDEWQNWEILRKERPLKIEVESEKKMVNWKDKEGAGSLWRSVVQLQRGMRPLSPHSPHKICTICSSGCAIQFWQRPLRIIFWGENDGDYHKVFPSWMSVQSPAPLLSLLRAVTWEREALEAPGCMAISLLIDLAPAIHQMTCSLLHMCT